MSVLSVEAVSSSGFKPLIKTKSGGSKTSFTQKLEREVFEGSELKAGYFLSEQVRERSSRGCSLVHEFMVFLWLLLN